MFQNSDIFGSCITHILYIYSTNIGTEYFKHGIYSPFFPLQNSFFHNSNEFGFCIIHILYIYSTNIGTEYFKHGIYSPFFPLQNAVCFIILTNLVPVLFTFYIFIQQIQVPNILNMVYTLRFFPLQNAVCFIIITYLVPVLITFYIQGVLKLKKKIIPAPKG